MFVRFAHDVCSLMLAIFVRFAHDICSLRSRCLLASLTMFAGCAGVLVEARNRIVRVFKYTCMSAVGSRPDHTGQFGISSVCIRFIRGKKNPHSAFRIPKSHHFRIIITRPGEAGLAKVEVMDWPFRLTSMVTFCPGG